jgi:hypothetical protein
MPNWCDNRLVVRETPGQVISLVVRETPSQVISLLDTVAGGSGRASQESQDGNHAG